MLAAAQKKPANNLSQSEIEQINECYGFIFETKDVSKIPLEELLTALQPDTMFERFAARKAASAGMTKEFLSIKGQKLQMESEEQPAVLS